MSAILPLGFYLLPHKIQEELLKRGAEYLFSRQEPKYIVDVFHTSKGRIELYIHRGGKYMQIS